MFSLNDEVLIAYGGSEIMLGVGGSGTRQTMTVFLKYPHSERGDRASKVNSIQRKEALDFNWGYKNMYILRKLS